MKQKEGAAFLASLSWSQFTSVWWARAHVQLLAQASVKRELMPFGALLQRWHALVRLANDEGCQIAMSYDAATWKVACEKSAAGVQFDARKLSTVDSEALAEAKRRRNGRQTHTTNAPSGAWHKSGDEIAAWKQGADNKGAWKSGGKFWKGSNVWKKQQWPRAEQKKT